MFIFIFLYFFFNFSFFLLPVVVIVAPHCLLSHIYANAKTFTEIGRREKNRRVHSLTDGKIMLIICANSTNSVLRVCIYVYIYSLHNLSFAVPSFLLLLLSRRERGKVFFTLLSTTIKRKQTLLLQKSKTENNVLENKAEQQSLHNHVSTNYYAICCKINK